LASIPIVVEKPRRTQAPANSKRRLAIRLTIVFMALAAIAGLDQVIPHVQLAPIAAIPIVIFAAAAPRWLALTVALVSAGAFALVDSDLLHLVRHIESSVPLDALMLAIGFTTLVVVTDMLRKNTAAKAVLEAALERTKAEEEHSRFLAHHDFLTGLPNRVLFEDRLRHALSHAARNSLPLAVIIVDVDNLKQLNDTLGHAMGDAALNEMGRHLLAQVRSEDTVARLSGDEFAIVLSHIARPEDAQTVVDKVSASFPITASDGTSEIVVTASIGHSLFPADGTTISELVHAADRSMYNFKRSRPEISATAS
jgi:diguanylate cyclase (GGDEF)-like protein